jgi:hypothetical protein
MSIEWPISVGSSLSKASIHSSVGGSGQHGMTSCLNGSAFLVFHNKTAGKKYGYDRWEGWQTDGSFRYTGQGVKGDQKFTRCNKSLLQMSALGKPIHLFQTDKKGNPYEYTGLVTLGDPTYELKLAPDKNGNERQVIVFHLIPIGHITAPNPIQVSNLVESTEGSWTPPKVESLNSTSSPKIPTQIELIEMQLQARFGNYMESIGDSVRTITISIQGQKGSLKPDFYLEARNWVVEAKPSASREHIRLAIGQVLDYTNLLKMGGKQVKPAILLPMPPPQDLKALMKELQIQLIVETKLGQYTFD